jgi:hypothetical protein
MDISKEKGKINGKIAALRVSSEGYPKMLLSEGKTSLNNVKSDSLSYLTDLIKSLVGFEALKETVVETLTYNLDDIELEVKLTLKKVLKSLVSCSIDPSLTDDFKQNGITLELDKIDFLDTMRIAPTSQAGKLLYNDIANLSESTDFNTFLYNTIQDNGASGFWGHVTTTNDILDIKFNPLGATPSDPNNSIVVKPSAYYSTKKLTDLNEAYIDSVKLFESTKLINNIIDSVFGSISVNVSKDKKTIQKELQIESIINKILQADEDVSIDDSFFQFSNDEYSNIEYKAELRRKGLKILKTDNEIESIVSIDRLTEISDEVDALDLTTTTSGLYKERLTNIVRNGLDRLADESAINANQEDKLNVKVSFIEDILKQIMTAIINVILSPKLILVFAINHKIIYGDSFKDVEDFMKKNKWLLTLVLESVRDVIVAILIKKALKEIKKLAIDNVIKTQIEKTNSKKAQLASLTGAPTEVIRSISGNLKL